MSAERISGRPGRGWRRWRDLSLAVCTAWLVVQNLALLTLVVWAGPRRALAAGTQLAQTALEVGGQLVVLGLATVMALALAAWLVHAPAPHGQADLAKREVGDEW